jgi:hypothetical protein
MVMRLLSILGFAGAAVAAAVHVVCLVGVNVEKWTSAVWWVNHAALLLFLPIMGLCTWAAFSGPVERRRGGVVRPRGPFAPLLPRHWLILGALGAYAGMHFAMYQTEQGPAVVYRDAAGFWEHDAAGVRRGLTEDEFDSRRAMMFRTFSAGWVVFYLIAAFMCRRTPAPAPVPPSGPRLRIPERAPFVGSGPWREGMN